MARTPRLRHMLLGTSVASLIPPKPQMHPQPRVTRGQSRGLGPLTQTSGPVRAPGLVAGAATKPTWACRAQSRCLWAQSRLPPRGLTPRLQDRVWADRGFNLFHLHPQREAAALVSVRRRASQSRDIHSNGEVQDKLRGADLLFIIYLFIYLFAF